MRFDQGCTYTAMGFTEPVVRKMDLRWAFNMMLAQAVLGSEHHVAMLERYKMELVKARLR